MSAGCCCRTEDTKSKYYLCNGTCEENVYEKCLFIMALNENNTILVCLLNT